MKTLLITIGIIVFVLIIVRKICMWLKKPLRRGELRHHIQAILDPIGCEKAYDFHFQQAWHIVDHYEIQLSEAGYDGTMDDLKSDAWHSLNRHNLRMESGVAQFQR